MGKFLFLSTLSLRRATTLICDVIAVMTISIHALLAESDIFLVAPGYKSFRFLSTLSLRRATRPKRYPAPACMYFYPRSPCGERLVDLVSIVTNKDFYPRSPCGERHAPSRKGGRVFVFLSTLSLRRATPRRNASYNCHSISIHALLAESDTPITFRHCTTYLFLSTLSLRRATSHLSKFNTSQRVFLSTLSLRRATNKISTIHITREDFYPRSPCGERRHQKYPTKYR